MKFVRDDEKPVWYFVKVNKIILKPIWSRQNFHKNRWKYDKNIQKDHLKSSKISTKII